MSDKSIIQFPAQKIPLTKKTEAWGIECIKAGEDLAIYRYSGIRESYKNKLINYNLANDILDTTDLERVCNPMGIKNAAFPATMQNYPIANPKIDLLVGEERKRRFEWTIRVINDDAISDKENGKKELIMEFVANKIKEIQQREFGPRLEMMQHQIELQQKKEQAHSQMAPPQGMPQEMPQGQPGQPQQQGPQMSPQMKEMTQQFQALQQEAQQSLQKELQALNKYLTFEYQDLRERMATHILNYLFKTLNLKEMFSRGFEDALIAGEEIYCTDIVSGEPIMRKVNPLNLHTVRSGESPFIDDSDIIVEDGFHSPGMVIDDYYNELTDAQVKMIDDGMTGSDADGFISIGEREPSFMLDSLIDTEASPNGGPYGSYWDPEGNIRVTRVCWRSFKQVGNLTYYDQETGEKLNTLVPESYKPKKDQGEEVKLLWINEWWEGTRIGKDIFVKIQARPIQFRSMTNLSKCSSGYAGMAYNINSSKAKSLMDRMKPYQYLYNVFMYRTELAFAKAKGKIASMDLAQVPDHWSMDKWMYYAEVNGWAVKDSFKEAKKGAAQGKLAGQMQSQAPVLDMDLGNYIQQHVQMLQFIELQLGKISGVSDQRQGQIENRELVGNVERAVSQSSHITEKWFGLHDNVKKQAMALLLETAKYAYRTKTDKRIQYVTDDLATSVLTLDGPQFNDADYGLIISDSSSDLELLGTLKGLAQAGMQNDKINFSQIMDLYMNPSLGAIRRNIEGFEQEKMQRDQANAEGQQKAQQENVQMQLRLAKEARDFELHKMEIEHKYKMEEEELRATIERSIQANDLDHDGIPDIVEVEKIQSQERIAEEERSLKERIEQGKLQLEWAKLGVDKSKVTLDKTKHDKDHTAKKTELQTKERIERFKVAAKPKPAKK